MKTILLFCIAAAAIHIVCGIVSIAYIALHHRAFVKKYHIRMETEPFGIKTAVDCLLSTLLPVIFWPVALLFYKFAEQEELDRSNGVNPVTGFRYW